MSVGPLRRSGNKNMIFIERDKMTTLTLFFSTIHGLHRQRVSNNKSAYNPPNIRPSTDRPMDVQP